jgi:hypothetical protein
MGLMRFIVPDDHSSEEVFRQAYLTGLDRVPWFVERRQENGQLVLERSVSDSGSLNIPWLVEGYGQLTLSTGTLRERPEPYHLPLELARGKVSQLRNQMSDWVIQGLEVPPEVHQKVAEATRLFSQAVVDPRQSEQSRELANQAIRTALEAGDQLAECYAEQALALRRRISNRLPSVLGANLGTSLLDDYTAGQYVQTFNAGCAPLVWREIQTSEGRLDWSISDKQIEWCRAHELTVCAGPLLQFDDHSLPDWLYMCEGDFDSILDFASEFVEAVVRRYRGKVDLWICSGRVNTADILSLSEEEKVRLAARSIELVHCLDSDTETVISFDRPWGEYLTQRKNDLPPLHFADALVRAGLGVTGLMLEMNVGYSARGTLQRDPLEFSRLLDYWSILGVPLYLAVTVPSASHADLLARCRETLSQGNWSTKAQQAWVTQYLPPLLAKPFVSGILWNQLRDFEPHDFPHGGLFDLRRHPKPALRQLASLRKAHFQ